MSKVQWLSKDLWVIAAGFAAAMHVGKFPAAIPVLQKELGVSLVQSGLLLSLVQAAGMCCALLLGSYAAKFGLKRCIMLGLGILSAASIWAGYAPSLNTLFITRIFEGFGFLLVTLTGAALIRQLVPNEEIAAKMGLWTAYMGGGMGIALLVTPFLLQELSWQHTWMIFALITLVVLVAIAIYIPRAASAAQTVSVIELLKITLKHRAAWLLAMIFCVYAGQWFAMVGFLPVIYAQNEIAATTAGVLTASVSIANAVGTFGCGLLLQRGFQPKTLVQFGFLIFAAGAFAFYGFQDHLSFFIQFAVVFSFSLFGGLVAATVFSQALHFAPSTLTISTTIGLILQSSALSQFVLPPAIAVLVSTTGTWLGAGIVMLILSMIGIVLTQLLFKPTTLAKNAS